MKNKKTERKCYGCGFVKPLTKEFFAKAGKSYDRLCKICKADWNDKYYKNHPKPVILQKTIGKYLVRNAKKTGLWTVYIKEPWVKLRSFECLEDAEAWIAEQR